MAIQNRFDKERRGSRFSFVSRVRYVLVADPMEKEYGALAFNVSIDGLCLFVDRRLEAGEELVIAKCILPYCRGKYKVQWAREKETGTYKVGLARQEVAKGTVRVQPPLPAGF